MSVNNAKGIKSSSESPDEELTLKVNITKRYVFSNMQIEAAKLEAKNLPLQAMAKKLKEISGKDKEPAVTSISRALKEFRDSGTADRIYTAFEELRKAHYWEMKRKMEVDVGKHLSHMRQTIKQMLLQGFWPFSRRLLPDAYFIDEQRKIELNHEHGAILKRAMQRIINGEHPYKVAKEEGLDASHIYRKFRNPFYKGCVRYGGEVLQGKHEALLDPEEWDKLQEALDLVGPVPKFGFKRSAQGTVPDIQKTEVIRQVCLLRAEGKTMAYIAEKTGLKYALIRKILNDPDYMKVVGKKLWQDAHDVKLDSHAALEKFGTNRKTQHHTKVIVYLKDHGPSLPKQISIGTQLGKKAVLAVLHALKDAGDADLETGHRRYNRWFLVSQTQMARHDEDPEKKVLEALAMPLTFTQIKDKTGLPHTTLARQLRKLSDQGKVERHRELGKRYQVYVKLSLEQEAA